MHQPDPVRTLRQIAGLLRPGGWLVAQEALRSPSPRSHPHLDVLGAYWDLLYELLERAGGVPHGAIDGLAGAARAAGLEVVTVDGSFATLDPEQGFDLHAATVLAARERAVASGIASGQQIDDLVSDLRAAKGGGYEWVSGPFFLDLTLRKPVAACKGRIASVRNDQGPGGSHRLRPGPGTSERVTGIEPPLSAWES